MKTHNLKNRFYAETDSFNFVSIFSVGGEGESFSRLTFFDDLDEDEVDEWDPGDVDTFGLTRGVSSVVIGSGFDEDFDALLIDARAARSRPLICSCCCRNELRKCSRCISAAVIADESTFGKRFGEPFGRNVDESRFGGKKLFEEELAAALNRDA